MNIFYLQWHITNRCNNRCLHCYQDTYSSEETSIENAILILNDFQMSCDVLKANPRISITGGDPFLNKNIFQILELASIFCENITILGNPEVIINNNIIIDKLKNIGIYNYQLSIDGVEETHDKIRYKGSYKATIKAIEKMVSEKMKVSIMSTVSNLNYKEMSTVMNIMYDLGVHNWSFARYVSKNDKFDIHPDDFFLFMKEIVAAHECYEKRGIPKLIKEPLLAAIYKDELDCNVKKISSGCAVGSASLTILPNNMIMACRRYQESDLGTWKKQGDILDAFIKNKKMISYRKINEIERCNDCDLLYYCRGCRAIAFLRTKSHYGIDPQCPKLAQQYID